ncbi:hypothetical protein D1BOALGB6SA_3516 [Olavius sp. associated proteobacterium Delta 1]|nr:hypothetical protein D1BOALGB6SA_3516 [Olavius sp. associated proteobacterium Delta 1]
MLKPGCPNCSFSMNMGFNGLHVKQIPLPEFCTQMTFREI